jgi:hypothetical protein
MKHDNQKCVYCGAASEVTRDHVPPKSFFPDPRPSNLVTVPSCRYCNQKGSKDEEVFLASLMFSDAAMKATGMAMWNSRLPRMLDRHRGVRLAIQQRMSQVELVSPAGIYFGSRLAHKIDYPRLDRVVLKTIKGLYFLEFSLPLAQDASVQCKWLNTPALAADTKSYLQYARLGRHGWPGVFEYKVAYLPEQSDKSIWFMLFFDYALWWGITGIWKESAVKSNN